jgi:HEAT repeat protein
VPDSEHVEAFLLAASHGGVRSNFGVVFSHITEPPVLDALLRKTHWLKDHQLQLCTHQVTRGVWWNDAELAKDLGRRDTEDAARVGEWVATSGTHDVLQDGLLEKLRLQVGGHFGARLRLLRIAMRRPRGASIQLLRSFLVDEDERLVRLAAREIVRRQPADYENILIQVMASAPESVRRVISRSVGQVGFDHYWERFDRMERSTRKTAGRAMLKVLADGIQRLERRLKGGPVEQRIKAMQIVQELGVADSVSPVLVNLCADPHPKLRSKAVALLAEINGVPPDLLMERALNDQDARVRANAIEVLEAKRRTEYVPLLTERARSSNHGRERANAIKAMARMRVGTAVSQLSNMLRDERPEHRISAMWALRQIGVWKMLRDVGQIAKEDTNLKVRRYAMTVLRGVADLLQSGTQSKAAG